MNFKKQINSIFCGCQKNKTGSNKESNDNKCPRCNSKPCKCKEEKNKHKDNCKCKTCN